MKNDIWLKDFMCLFEDSEFFPNEKMSNNKKINSITRLIFIIYIIMLISNYKYSLLFLLLSMLIILILYFINTKEYYTPMDTTSNIIKNNLLSQNSNSRQKMSLKPKIAPRSHDREVWSYPSYRHSAINYNQARYDISEDYTPIEQKEDYKDYDPRLKTYTDFTLDNIEQTCYNRYGNKESTSFDSQDTPSQNTPSQTTSITDVISNDTSQPQMIKEKFSAVKSQNNTKFQNTQSGMTPIDSVISQNNTNFKDFNVPNQNMLIPKTITSIYGPGEVTNEERIKYLTQIQPDQYSYSDMSYPINSNLGISYTPEILPRVLDQVATPYGTYPLFHRIDPQLIRDDNIPPERFEELPRRTTWSAKYSGLDAAPGTVNFEDIYDPRFNGYGDEYRSYGDVNLGQVQYYYSDVDAYRNPNFGIRSKVDFIDYTDPMGRVMPEYNRQVGVNDIKNSVHDQYTSDALYFREGLQERLMRKRNRELWQLRQAPVRKDNNTQSFTY